MDMSISSTRSSPQSCRWSLLSSSLVGALKATSLIATVDGLDQQTVFAPINSGMSMSSNANISFTAATAAHPGLTTSQLATILTYHVVPRVFYSPAYNGRKRQFLPTVNGETICITKVKGQLC
ncbi:hypothetical protein BC937DRAFT_89674 [Endogone sp. FLAS-F59071]|nr:hypothetical protein BC937DRAFT_89674 [Endogone sp. FLAS-F59071]|eukprot:RUS17650.1 hypothetical protein BC937DRAFT_89674 [Endogone sp. FLAS-F59071]